jgi:hypothetical protein
MKTIEHLLNYHPVDLKDHPHKLPDLIWKFLDILKSRPMNKVEIADYFRGDETATPSIVDELIELNLIEIVEYSYEEWQASKTSHRVTKVQIGNSKKEESGPEPESEPPIENSDGEEEVSFSIG